MFKAYELFLKNFDEKVQLYFERDKSKIKCKKGCSFCCENGDYPLSLLEMAYLMQGYNSLNKELHDKVRENIRNLITQKTKEGKLDSYSCPFLINKKCVVYNYRPLVCRMYGLAYMRKDGIVNLPECASCGLNYSENFDGETINFEPIKEELNLNKIITSNSDLKFGQIKSMIDWFIV